MDSETRLFEDYTSTRSRDALVRLLQAHQHSIYNICFQVLGQAQDAEDASQEVLLKIPGEAAGLPDAESFRRWIHRVSLNAALDARRKRERRSKHEGRAAMPSTRSAPPVDESRQALFEALARLDDENRSLIVEHYFERVPLEELGRRRAVSSVAVWKRIDRAREILRTSLSGAGFAALTPGAEQALDSIRPVRAPRGLVAGGAKSILPTAAIVVAILATGMITGAALVFRNRPESPVAPSVAPPSPVETAKTVQPPPPGTASTRGGSETPPPAEPRAVSSETIVQDATDPSGAVMAPDGKPVADVLVFWGTQERGRGDEPFKPFKPERIKDGVRTGADGKFTLRGTGEVITFWHPDHSIVTVPVKGAGSVKLTPRGTIKGRVVDADGKPQAGVTVGLDRARPVTTDAEGRFEFDKVEAGIRGLGFLPQRGVAVEIAAGETVEVEIGPGLDVTIDLREFPNPPAEDLLVIVGTGKVAAFSGGKAAPPGNLEVKNMLPGKYWIRAARSQVLARLTVEGREATAEFGSAELAVSSEAAATVYVVPSGTNELLALQLRRFGAFKEVAPGKPATWTHLPAGDYDVRDRYDRILAKAAVGATGAKVTLKSK